MWLPVITSPKLRVGCLHVHGVGGYLNRLGHLADFEHQIETQLIVGVQRNVCLFVALEALSLYFEPVLAHRK